MTSSNLRDLAAAAIAASLLLCVATGAQANDEREWDRKHWTQQHWDHRDHHRHERVEHVYHHEPASRVVYEQPVVVMPAPVYRAPAYAPPVEPSLNFNFTIPLR